MKARYTSLDGNFALELEYETIKDLFEKVASFEEIFGQNTICKCGNESTRPSVRVVDDNSYYERKCDKCGKSFSFGQHKKGGSLFPKWEKGWNKWNAEAVAQEKSAVKGDKK